IIGFGPFFVALAVFDLIGAAALWILIKEPKEPGEPDAGLAVSQ
ncbi:MFS transporter, partial [Pantoea allii]